MKISYNWLKQYVPKLIKADKLPDVFTYHLCEVEGVEKKGRDTIFDINILPNRAHDLLSHQGVARELASFLKTKYIDPALKYKIPKSQPTDLKIEIKTDKCRRYMGRIIRGIKVAPSPDWMVKRLESVGQRSINNIVDIANLVMFDCGQPIHAFDLDKVNGGIIIREAQETEAITTLDNKAVKLKSSNMVIADRQSVLAVAGIKGGRQAEIDENTQNIILEVANFDPVSVRKTTQALNIFTDAKKRFENDLSPELAPFAMRELSALILEMCPKTVFEDIVDVYPTEQAKRKLSFSANRISNILGLVVSVNKIKDILKRYNFEFKEKNGTFEIFIPFLRFDLATEEDMAEEIGRILGYDKVKGKIPKINFKPQVNETYRKINWARNKLLNDGYSEVMTYTFCDQGEVEVMQSASDKKFLRTNLTDGLKESMKLNQINSPFLGMEEIKIFEIGTVFKKNGEEMHVAYADKKEIKEMKLEQFISENASLEKHGYFSTEKFLVLAPSRSQVSSKKHSPSFKMWSPFPFIARDIAVWVPKKVSSAEVIKIIKNGAGELVVRGPELFDKFEKNNQISYALRLVFQSYKKTLTDEEVNVIMTKITNKIKKNKAWQVR